MVRTLKDLDVNSSFSPGDGVVGVVGVVGGEQHSSAYHKPIEHNTNSKAKATSTSNNNSNKKNMTFQVHHIPDLPMADAALAMINRVCQEFAPIIERRGYNVQSVSEMCCCNDGLDFVGSRRSSKRKIMPRNVWGYNQTTFRGGRGKSHSIHLRMRHPGSHGRLLLYEDVAGTMAHELAHCEIGPHNEQFNKLMDDILEEHMMLQCQGYVPFTGQGVALGKDNTQKGVGGPGAAAMARQAKGGGGGQILGGDNKFTKWLSPGEAACAAAEARRRQQNMRLRGTHCCQPVTITIPDDDDDSEPIVEVGVPAPSQNKHDNDGKLVVGKQQRKAGEKKKRPAETSIIKQDDTKDTKKPAKSMMDKDAIIDLTEDGNSSPLVVLDSKPAAFIQQKPAFSENTKWACHRCTFLNPAMALACSMCSMEKHRRE